MLRFTLGILPVGGEFIAQVVVHAVPVALLGAVVATLLFVAAKPLFLGYVSTLARQSVVYGSLAGIVAAVVWAWMVAMIGLFGGQMASHCQAVIFEGQPIEEVERRHLTTDADTKRNRA